MTHRDDFPELSARRARRRDAGHRKSRSTMSDSSGKPPYRSLLGRFAPSMRRGRQQALTLSGTACGLLPTRTFPEAIPRGHYYRPLV